MKELFWVNAVGEIAPEFIEEAGDDHFNQFEERNSFRKHHGKFAALSGFKRVAIIVIATLVAAFGLLMMNEKVRAAVLRVFITRVDDGFVNVHFCGEDTGSDSTAETDIFDVTVGYIPEGLTLFENENKSANVTRSFLISTEETINDGFQPFIVLDIVASSEAEWGWKVNTYDEINHAELNGMDAFVLEKSWYQEETEVCMTVITFGDCNILVNIAGMNLSHEEVWKVAENIRW